MKNENEQIKIHTNFRETFLIIKKKLPLGEFIFTFLLFT